MHIRVLESTIRSEIDDIWAEKADAIAEGRFDITAEAYAIACALASAADGVTLDGASSPEALAEMRRVCAEAGIGDENVAVYLQVYALKGA